MGSFYKAQLNDFVASQHVKADLVLDIGGAQHPIEGRTASWDVKQYMIVDLHTPHVTLRSPNIHWDMNESDSCDTEDKVYLGIVDLIYMLGVMDYVINPNIAMDNIYRLLKEGGTAWIEFPFVYPIHNPVDDEGCRYSEGCIRRLAKQANLNIEEIIYKRPLPDNPFLRMFYEKDGMRAARGVDHNVTGYIVRFTR